MPPSRKAAYALVEAELRAIPGIQIDDGGYDIWKPAATLNPLVSGPLLKAIDTWTKDGGPGPLHSIRGAVERWRANTSDTETAMRDIAAALQQDDEGLWPVPGRRPFNLDPDVPDSDEP